jgi:hypothetical protein
MRHRLAMSQKPTTCGLDRCANEMNWCHAGRYLFARSRHGSTTSTQSRNSTGRRIDLADGLRTGVSYEREEGKPASKIMRLFDINENKEYGTFVSGPTESTPLACVVKLPV